VKTVEVDVAILGAGTAGLTARRSVEKSGATAVMIDPGPFGTTCARVGCMPSKLLIAAADAAHEARHMEVFGVSAGPVRVDGRAVMERVRRERDRFVGFVTRATDEHQAEGRLLRGRARFLDANTVQVDDHTQVVARSFVVATGSSPFIPPPFRELGDRMALNDDVFYWDDLPESALVAGTGVIGLELGQALHRLGVRVTIVGVGGRVGPFSDPAVRAEARRVIGGELPLFPDYALKELRRTDGGVYARFTDGEGAEHEGEWSLALVAAGRRPNLKGLGLENTGLELDERGVPRFNHRTCQLGASHIFMAGDVTNFIPLLHEAADEGHIAGANAARWPQVLAGHRRARLAVVFTDPQMAVVGTPYEELPPRRWQAGEVDYGDQGRARVMNKHAGIVRIYGHIEHGTLLGAELFGPRVEHTAHLLSWAIQQRLTVEQALQMPFYHPVVEEGIRTALRDLETNLRFAPPPGNCCEEDGPGT
jgi:dihydrolipoamide dehydrogenase